MKHPAGILFEGVSGAADDRTFAVSALSTTLGRLPGATELQSVWFWCTVRPCYPGSPGTLQLYSVATGKSLRTWKWGTSPDPADPGRSYGSDFLPDENGVGLTWLAGGRTLAFTYYAHGQDPAIRTLDTTRPAADLVASSRRVFTLPAGGPDPCSEAMLTPDGRTVVCGTRQPFLTGCSTGTLEIDAYSTATGKRERVLYRYSGRCGPADGAGVGALGWAGSQNTVVAMVDILTSVTTISGSTGKPSIRARSTSAF